MATAEKILIDAIRKIAKTDEDFRSLLQTVRNRGGLDGVYKEIGGFDEAQYKSCCAGEKTGSEEPAETVPADITGDAPPDMSGGIGEDWTDCATGQPVRFSPKGFTQAETCKECGPDETWRESWYWRISQIPRQYFGATVSEVAKKWVDGEFDIADSNFYFKSYDIGEQAFETDTLITYGNATVAVRRVVINTGQTTVTDYNVSLSNRNCLAYPSEPYCSITDAPEVCGDDWESDGTTEYTLRNGCLVASKCDPDAAGGATGCNECVTICNSASQERTFCGTSDGGYIVYDASGQYKGGKYDGNGKREELIESGKTGGFL